MKSFNYLLRGRRGAVSGILFDNLEVPIAAERHSSNKPMVNRGNWFNSVAAILMHNRLKPAINNNLPEFSATIPYLIQIRCAKTRQEEKKYTFLDFDVCHFVVLLLHSVQFKVSVNTTFIVHRTVKELHVSIL